MLEQLFDLPRKKYGNYGEVEMLPYLIKEIKDFKWFIWGAGVRGTYVCDWIENTYHIRPDFIVDRNKKLGENLVSGVKIITPEELLKMPLKHWMAIITPVLYEQSPEVHKEIEDILKEVEEESENCIISVYTYPRYQEFIPIFYSFIKDNLKLFERTYYLLEDDLSKETFLEYLKAYITCSPYAGETLPEEYKYWGIDFDQRFITLKEDECVLHIGASIGDTVYQYLKVDNPYKKIIAVEGQETTCQVLKKNLSCLKDTVKNKIQIDNFLMSGDVHTIDNIYKNDNISLITMDIEGAELPVLMSAVNTIKEKRPVLAICAYHKKEDLIEIPYWIARNTRDYVFLLRMYPSNFGFYADQILQVSELVFYAIPRERYIFSEL